MNAGVASDVDRLEWTGGKLRARRPVYSGKAFATVEVSSTPATATTRPNAFPAEETGGGAAEVVEVSVAAESKAKLLETAYGRFINDGYWLLAPWKVFDPGVRREYAGEKPGPDGALCDVLKLSFDGVGLTPKDVYWLWITRDGRHMVQWQYVLGGAAEEPTTALWKDWRTFGGIGLSLDKPMTGRPLRILFENVAVSPTRDDSQFTAPPAAAPSPTP